MLIRITVMILRVCALLALILGLLFWFTNVADTLVPVHMLLGILVMLSLWVLAFGIATAAKGKSIPLAVVAFVWGLVMLFVGLNQNGSLYLNSSTHWIIQIVHFILGIGAIGLGEMISGRYRRMNVQTAQVQA
ncbi:MAG TPA: hypothetical protein VL461_01065 [Dictyobacter sp.]|jgi:hypothetical protein|nr:hypothetical protein [Dictyobacter sp.]